MVKGQRRRWTRDGHLAEAEKAFAVKLAAAKKVLVKEWVTTPGSTRTTYPRLKVVG